MEINNIEVYGFRASIRGMRNPLNSWHMSDSYIDKNCLLNDKDFYNNIENFVLGEKDLNLAQRLIKAGSEHCKFLRFITVSCDLLLPLYIYKELDTYKFIEKNSCSTMHTITSRLLTQDDFEYDEWTTAKENILHYINEMILEYQNSTDTERKKVLFRRIIQDLPSSFLQKRTIITNYAELRNIYKQRSRHKLIEWHKICNWIENDLPYAKELIIF